MCCRHEFGKILLLHFGRMDLFDERPLGTSEKKIIGEFDVVGRVMRTFDIVDLASPVTSMFGPILKACFTRLIPEE